MSCRKNQNREPKARSHEEKFKIWAMLSLRENELRRNMMDLFKFFKDPVEETLDLFYLGYRVEVRGGQPTAEQRRNRLSF